LCYAEALTQTMKGMKQIEDMKGGEWKLESLILKSRSPLQVSVGLLL
jgi:hypothetical protein